jgi:general secretion pathway protein I
MKTVNQSVWDSIGQTGQVARTRHVTPYSAQANFGGCRRHKKTNQAFEISINVCSFDSAGADRLVAARHRQTGCRCHPITPRRKAHSGFTLLEVIFAIAVLVGALAIIGQFVHSGVRVAGEAEALTVAQLLCESTLAQAIAGAIPLEPAAGVPIDTMPDWEYTLAIGTVDANSGLMALQVTVTNASSSPRPVEFSLIRWIVDPEYVPTPESTTTPSTTSSTASTQ